MFHNAVEKPKHRSPLRKKWGKQYFVFKRKLKWWFSDTKFAKSRPDTLCTHTLAEHKSFLLRPLKDVDMYLQHNKITNLRIAISHLDDVVIRPGETFSIWKLVGATTKRKGYLEGLVLDNGKISKGIGGGLCQLGNLLYWLFLHTDLTIIERYRHSYDVFPDINRTIPFACGATLSYNYIDLQVKNESDSTFKINLWLDDEYLNGKISCDKEAQFSYKIEERNHQFVLQWWGGYTRHNQIWKIKTNLASRESEEFLVAENHALMMYNPLLPE